MGELAVLLCPTCAAPVPLADGAACACRHCGVAVPIPEAHRQLRALRRGDERTRAQAEALARRLVPAGRTLRALA